MSAGKAQGLQRSIWEYGPLDLQFNVRRARREQRDKRTWQRLAHPYLSRFSRDVESRWSSTSNAEYVSHEARRCYLQSKLFSHAPEFRGTLHRLDHVLHIAVSRLSIDDHESRTLVNTSSGTSFCLISSMRSFLRFVTSAFVGYRKMLACGHCKGSITYRTALRFLKFSHGGSYLLTNKENRIISPYTILLTILFINVSERCIRSTSLDQARTGPTWNCDGTVEMQVALVALLLACENSAGVILAMGGCRRHSYKYIPIERAEELRSSLLTTAMPPGRRLDSESRHRIIVSMNCETSETPPLRSAVLEFGVEFLDLDEVLVAILVLRDLSHRVDTDNYVLTSVY